MSIKYLFIPQTDGKILNTKKFKYSYISKRKFKEKNNARVTGSIQLKDLKKSNDGSKTDKLLEVNKNIQFYINENINHPQGYLEAVNMETNKTEYIAIDSKFPLMLLVFPMTLVYPIVATAAISLVAVINLYLSTPKSILPALESNVTTYDGKDIEFKDPKVAGFQSEAIIMAEAPVLSYYDITNTKGYDSIPLINKDTNTVDLQYIIYDENGEKLCETGRITPNNTAWWKAVNVLKKGETKVLIRIKTFYTPANSSEVIEGNMNTYKSTINYK